MEATAPEKWKRNVDSSILKEKYEYTPFHSSSDRSEQNQERDNL